MSAPDDSGGLLRGRVAIVSGIGPGMGRDISLALAAQGADIVLGGRTESKLEGVAKEVAKTHPEARVLNCAYGAYTLPPLKIEKLEPTVLVCIVGGRRPIMKPGNAKAEGEAAPEALRAAWAKKTTTSRSNR